MSCKSNRGCVKGGATILAFQIALSTQLMVAGPPTGAVVGWGSNIAGEATGSPSFPLSNGVVVVTGAPCATGIVTIVGQFLTNGTAVSAGAGFGLALRSDGSLVGWGDNQACRATGTDSDGRILTNVVGIAAGGAFGLALNHDGTVATWGQNKVPPALGKVRAIAAGLSHNFALLEDGTIACWGGGRSSLAGLSNIVAIAAAKSWFWHDIALKSDGTIIEQHPSGQEIVAVDPDVIAISAGYNHSLAVRRNGTVFGWGNDNQGQATGDRTNRAPNDPTISKGLVSFSGQVLSNVVAIAAGHEYSLALKRDGTVVAWGNKRFYRDVPEALTNVVAIAAGEDFCLAITTNRNVLTTKW
jgi:alpha-tubulin suppressor-like RCC1 family protein